MPPISKPTFQGQIAIIIPASFGIFFLTMLFDRGDTPGRALLFRNLNTPVDVATELKDSADFTAPVFRFLSRTISFIGLPVVAVPVPLKPLPIGVQIIAAPWREDVALKAARALERAGIVAAPNLPD